MGPLSGKRVLDLTRVLAGPWATQMLGDLGADVIKIERPGTGDDARHYGPAWLSDDAGKPTPDSSFYISANRNKRSLTVDLQSADGQEIIRRLAACSDILKENFLPGAMARIGLDHDSLRAINPRLIYCSLTGYGQSGPYSARPGYDAVFQAQSGLMSVTGLPDDAPGGGPVRIGPSLVDVSTGANAAIAMIAALYHRDLQSGEGQHIDVAMLDTALAMQSTAIQGFLTGGIIPERLGTAGNGGHPSRLFHCHDGDIFLSAGNSAQYKALCQILGLPELATDPRFATAALRFKNRQMWDEIAEPVVHRRDRNELQERLIEAKIPCSVINRYDDVFADEHVKQRGLQIEMPHPAAAGAAVSMVANPIRLSGSPVEYQRHPPMLGEHSEEILRDLCGFDDEEIALLRGQRVI